VRRGGPRQKAGVTIEIQTASPPVLSMLDNARDCI
jgi:hypothetical protein